MLPDARNEPRIRVLNTPRWGTFGVLLLVSLGVFAETDSAPVKFNLLSKEMVQRRLDTYKGNDTARGDALKRMFADAGCAGTQATEQTVPGRKQPNVICVLPGTTAEMVVIGAHFDHVDAGDGIVDNWSGASLLPSLCQGLAMAPRRLTYVFVGFAGEENGLVGSKFYVKQMSIAQIAQTRLMINMDTLGLGPTEVWVRQSDPAQVSLLAGVAKAIKVPVTGVNVDGLGESDEESFIARQVCVLMVHSLTPETTHVLHHAADNPHAIRFEDLYETYRLMSVYLAVLDTKMPDEPHACAARPVDMGAARSPGARRGMRMPGPSTPAAVH